MRFQAAGQTIDPDTATRDSPAGDNYGGVMDAIADTAGAPVREERLEFTGQLGAFIGLQIVNLLLTIVTLGIYRFWAKARVRRYLWANTKVYGEPFEYTGTGMELFLGFLAAFVVVLVPLVAYGVAIGLLFAGNQLMVSVALLVIYPFIFYLVGVAIFRTLRYQLSRTYWRGIRGGSDDGGWGYGLYYLGQVALAIVTLGFAAPWVSARLWNARLNKMSYGPYPFEANADGGQLFKRYLAVLIPMLALLAVFFAFFGNSYMAMMSGDPSAVQVPTGIESWAWLFLLLYVVIAIGGLWYWAAYYRHVVGHTTLGPLRLSFDARAREWVMLALTNLLIIVVTFGLGLLIITYRNWKFVMKHAALLGDPQIDSFTQSTTTSAKHGEGLADAFDMGAF
jgi:uncharacterized membrane protein YjgN (DUF898 family)